MDEVFFEVEGTPVPKGRPRFGNGRTYTDRKTVLAERAIRDAYLQVVGNRLPHEGPVSVVFEAEFLPAQSWPKKKRIAALSGELLHTIRPDLDNLLKVLDGLNGVAWVDDAQVWSVTARKSFSTNPATRVWILFHHT